MAIQSCLERIAAAVMVAGPWSQLIVMGPMPSTKSVRMGRVNIICLFFQAECDYSLFHGASFQSNRPERFWGSLWAADRRDYWGLAELGTPC